ncbi:LOW QUALITY PROTEIN: ATP-dependent protease ATPase subunit HslU-like [Condylostylus longicornis]|uniref:LOW QUALITY PROTEIN: ATP-dependent protease ATPase subunit HslU-like n=1 Tax=Condylostylus longicornis TaxID=2530218 RepID=UPI00244E0457|nr:LOW QUALITY PROTEIN: ATP-dependent protease ATPase subunit HslU-like [Condylostylus longicornis]
MAQLRITLPKNPPSRLSNVSGGSFFVKPENGAKPADENRESSPSTSQAQVSSNSVKDLKPSEIVEFLNQHIVGQLEAKKAVANALRSRWRRQQLRNDELKDDIAPKNILMIGPTGVGKTEIARRMAKILDAPFIKVEATKYTEVGFHGRDVDTIIKDLVELAVRRQYIRLEAEFFPQAQRSADERILQALTGQLTIEADVEMYESLRLGRLDNQVVSVEVPYSMTGGGGLSSDLPDFSSGNNSTDFTPFTSSGSQFWNPSSGGNGGWRSSAFGSSRTRERLEKRTISVKEARAVLANVEFARMIGSVAKSRITQQAIEAVEQEGIVFLDEIDKICSNKSHAYSGPDASAEGVQRDLLPLIEGTTINTRYGNVKTDHILFIASGAFHSVKPSDMMAELQGRLPVRVELKPLTEGDFRKILTDTRHNLLEQNIALLATEGVTLLFEPAATNEIARVAYEVNSFVENIGARRLVTIIEKIMEEISFVAPEMETGSLVRITEDVVGRAVHPMTQNSDLHKPTAYFLKWGEAALTPFNIYDYYQEQLASGGLHIKERNNDLDETEGVEMPT